MTSKTFLAAGTSWVGTVGVWFSQLSHAIGIMCALASLVATVYAIRVSRARLKYLERNETDAEDKRP